MLNLVTSVTVLPTPTVPPLSGTVTAVAKTVFKTVTATVSTSNDGASSGAPSSWMPWATLGAAIVAALVAWRGIVVQDKLGRASLRATARSSFAARDAGRVAREALESSKQSAAAATTSAAAATKSAEAATDAVAVNARSAGAAEQAAEAAKAAVGVNAASAADVAVRAEVDALARRYQQAAEQLGHDKAPVRLAGVYTLAHLADEWIGQRQTCIDVLCAYLRMPSAAGLGRTDVEPGELQVRRSIVAIIAERVTANPVGVSWSDCRFDFEGVRFDSSSFFAATFDKYVTFRGAHFIGECSFYSLHIPQGASFDEVVVESGLLSFTSLDLHDSNANFTDLTVLKGGHLAVSAPKLSKASRLLFTNHKPGTRIEGELSIWTPPGQVSIGQIHFALMNFAPDSTFKLTIGSANDEFRILDKTEWPRMEVADSWFEEGTNFNVHPALLESGVLIWSRNHMSPIDQLSFIIPEHSTGEDQP